MNANCSVFRAEHQDKIGREIRLGCNCIVNFAALRSQKYLDVIVDI